MGKTFSTGLLTNGIWQDSSNNIGIGGAANASYKLAVTGAGLFSGALTASGTIISSMGNNSQIFRSNTGTTGYMYATISNSGANLTLGIDQSAGGALANGSLGYAAIFGNAASAATQITSNNFVGITLLPNLNVGIGTNAPNSNLTIYSANYPFMNIRNANSGVYGMTFGFATLNGDVDLWNYENGYIRIGTNNVERLRVVAGGYTKITNTGTFINLNGNYHEIVTNRTNDNIVYFANTAASPYGPYTWFVNASPNNTSNYFLACGDSVNDKAIIYSNGTYGSRTGTYGSIISDIKYKQDITDANSQWDDIKNLRVVNFKYKEDVELDGENALRQIGFIAQEVEAVSPNLVYEAGKKDTEETWKSVKTSIIHLKAVKALQEAMTRIEQLEAKVTALENK